MLRTFLEPLRVPFWIRAIRPSRTPKLLFGIRTATRWSARLPPDAGGNYSAPLIPIGNYSISAEASGFKKEDRTGIVLNVNDDLKINIVLQVGAMTETVEVRADATHVELGSPASATTIEGTQVRELTLNTRNYEQLVSLMPGVSANTTDELFIGNSAPSGFAATLPYSINGNRNSSNNWTARRRR